MNNQTIEEIARELPETFVSLVMEETDIRRLKKMKSTRHCYQRRALIQARIENLLHTAVN